MRKALRSLIIFSLILVVFASFVGCSPKSNSQKNQQNSEAQKIVEDKKNTDKLKQNKEVLDGKVYTQNGWVVATMIIKENINEKDAKTLAENYAKQLKKQYGNMKVSVQAVKNNKNIADIEIE